jgi:hypothetical protein
MSTEPGATDSGPKVDQPDAAPEGPGDSAPEVNAASPVKPEESTAGVTNGKPEGRARRGGRSRSVVVGVLVVVFSLLTAITYVAAWGHYVILTNRGFEKTVVPVGTDPAVTSTIAATLTDQIYTSLNAQQVVANALPPRADFLAGPITNGTKGYVQNAVTNVLQSKQFQTLWKQAVDFAHAQLLSVLKGNSQAIKTTNGQVVLDLVPLLNSALQSLEGFVSGVVGHPVNLPTLTASDIPANACGQISAALNRPLPATCGQIPLFPSNRLDQARRVVRIFNGVLILLLILTPLVAALALWVSRRRRRTLLQLSAGAVLALVIIRRVVNWLSTSLVDKGMPQNRSALRAILSHIFHTYFSISRWLLLGLIAVFVIALVTGPYPWAVSLRRVATHYGKEGWNLAQGVTGRARDDRTLEWVRSHLDLLRFLGVAVAVLLLIVLSVSWVGLLVIALLLAAYEWWMYRLGQSGPPTEPGGQPPAPRETGPAGVA